MPEISFHILTIFPDMFTSPLSESILRRAIDGGAIDIDIRNIRDFTEDRHHVTDDAPYGGGAGMVMKPEPIVAAVESIRDSLAVKHASRVVYMSPQGALFTQKEAHRLAQYDDLILLCGRYEGVDERAIELVVDEELSIGDYVLTGGELAAMVVVDAVSRLVPGVVGRAESVENDSFGQGQGLLDWPHYTRPETFRGLRVPDVLLSGHHANIEEWRRKMAMEKTKRVRPDLLEARNRKENNDPDGDQ